ncbi:MAG TPA: SRPBCC domain-containing protein [Acidimicrobiales bacterium]
MGLRIALGATVKAPRETVYEALRTSEGQRSFWTSDCELTDPTGRFGFAQAPVDLHVTIASTSNEVVSMTVTSGFPGWTGSTWSWSLSSDVDHPDETSVQFRHVDFESDYSEDALAYTAQSWAMILDHLARFMESGIAQPFFTNEVE